MNDISTHRSGARAGHGARWSVTRCAALLLAASACNGREAVGTGNTNWVVACDKTSECSGELTCQCNLCGPTCDGTLTCSDSGGKPVCDDGHSSGGAGNGGGNSSGSSNGSECAAFPTGAQTPTPTSSTFQRVEAAPQVDRLLVDGESLYWFDFDGKLSWTDGIGPVPTRIPVVLRAAPEEPWALTGPLFANDTFVFWTEAPRPPEGGLPEPSFPGPPGRLYMIAKANSDGTLQDPVPQLMFEDSESVLSLVGVAGDQIFFRAENSNVSVYAIRVAEPEPRAINVFIPSSGPSDERLVRVPSAAQVVGNTIYWIVEGESSNDVNGYYQDLYRTDLAGNDPVLVTQVKGEFRVEGERVMWQEERLVQNPLVLDQNFVMLNPDTGCGGPLPNVGESIQSWLFDDQYVYWYSYNALGSVSNSTDGSGASSGFGRSPLLRVDLDTGAMEEIVIPGFDGVTATDHLLGQNDAHLFVYGSVGLVAIDKIPASGECIWGTDNLLGGVDVAASPRQDCGILEVADEASVTAAFDCLSAAPNDVGAQFSINACLDCLALSTYVRAPSGVLYRIQQDNDLTGGNASSVERCDTLQVSSVDVECVGSESLYSCN